MPSRELSPETPTQTRPKRVGQSGGAKGGQWNPNGLCVRNAFLGVTLKETKTGAE